MKKIVFVVGAIAALVLPPSAALALHSAAATKPTKYELLLATIECGMERGTGPVKQAEFNSMYPAPRPLLFCIELKAYELAIERGAAPAEARIFCAQERAANPDFRLDYPDGLEQCIRLESLA